MATLREVRRRILGVKSTEKITKAMKMVAAAKLRRAQSGVLAARPYARNVRDLLHHLVENAEAESTELLRTREVQRVAVVVVTADRGLCGAFNANLIRATVAHLQKEYPGWNEQDRVRLFCVGRKGSDFFSKHAYRIVEKFVGVYSHLEFSEARRIAGLLIEGYRQGQFDRVDILYNEFKSISQQRIVMEQFLPVPREGEGGGTRKGPTDYIYEPSRGQILEALLPRHLNFQIWRILLESNAAEQGARMAAMENATQNASDLIEHLQLQYNKARQASITKELLEVIGGAEALSQSA